MIMHTAFISNKLSMADLQRIYITALYRMEILQGIGVAFSNRSDRWNFISGYILYCFFGLNPVICYIFQTDFADFAGNLSVFWYMGVCILYFGWRLVRTYHQKEYRKNFIVCAGFRYFLFVTVYFSQNVCTHGIGRTLDSYSSNCYMDI